MLPARHLHPSLENVNCDYKSRRRYRSSKIPSPLTVAQKLYTQLHLGTDYQQRDSPTLQRSISSALSSTSSGSFFRDEQTREERLSRQSDPLYRYRGSGTGLVLNPIVLAQFISTLAVLAHAGRNAPQWLALVAPDSLELAITLGTRPVSQADDDDEDPDPALRVEWGQATTSKDKEASVSSLHSSWHWSFLTGVWTWTGGGLWGSNIRDWH
jgi:hypothetical protein